MTTNTNTVLENVGAKNEVLENAKKILAGNTDELNLLAGYTSNHYVLAMIIIQRLGRMQHKANKNKAEWTGLNKKYLFGFILDRDLYKFQTLVPSLTKELFADIFEHSFTLIKEDLEENEKSEFTLNVRGFAAYKNSFFEIRELLEIEYSAVIVPCGSPLVCVAKPCDVLDKLDLPRTEYLHVSSKRAGFSNDKFLAEVNFHIKDICSFSGKTDVAFVLDALLKRLSVLKYACIPNEVMKGRLDSSLEVIVLNK